MESLNEQLMVALPSDHKILTEVTKRSKAFWGYSPEQMEKWEEELTITMSYIVANQVYKLMIDNKLVGYYALLKAENTDKIKLDNLFVLPEYMGKGYGKVLLEDCICRVKEQGFNVLTLDADPHAESFYIHCGFKTVGKLASSISGRYLPLMEFSLMS
ncbi:GNAT family N-acetyltransferase [Limibacter armeniacum]|uniref:GNAT family N-acetyltransferase n=1 Tax=Limibacter armeniacum TaxID=466084 RepID=UPI002FE66210